MKAEGRAEVYKQHILALMPLYRRVCAVIYVSWLSVEGFGAALYHFTSPQTLDSRVPGVESSVMYFVGFGLLLVLLHSYVGGQFAQYGFRLTTFVHQVTLTALSFLLLIHSTNEIASCQ